MKTEKFIKKAKIVHGSRYDYSKVHYIDAKTKICIICPEHGGFWQRPLNHLKGYGCKGCQYEKLSKQNKMTINEFISKSIKLYGDKYSYEKTIYEKNNKKVIITCKEHGDFSITPNDFLDGHGCKQCANETISLKLRSNTKKFIEKAKGVHGDKYDYSKVEYYGNEDKICIICPEHGEFWQTPHTHLSGCGCKKCSIKIRSEKRRHSLLAFINKANSIHKNKYDYSLIKEYNNGKEKLPIICPIHGIFYQRAEDHLFGHGCKNCYKSKLEEEIANLLEDNNIKYKYRLKNKFDCTELDFYLPDFKICIECQGLQHFKPVDFGGKGLKYATEQFEKIIKNDELKLKNTKKHNIKLLYYSNVIFDFPYNVFTNKEELLNEIKNGKK